MCHQQGLYDVLSRPFREHSVSGATLLDEAVFDEDFVTTTLGVANKIQAKKTLMAVRRLRTTCDEFEHGKVFDAKNDDNESYDFILGGGKTIQAMDRLVSTILCSTFKIKTMEYRTPVKRRRTAQSSAANHIYYGNGIRVDETAPSFIPINYSQ